jgi:hypothetical protein
MLSRCIGRFRTAGSWGVPVADALRWCTLPWGPLHSQDAQAQGQIATFPAPALAVQASYPPEQSNFYVEQWRRYTWQISRGQ